MSMSSMWHLKEEDLGVIALKVPNVAKEKV